MPDIQFCDVECGEPAELIAGKGAIVMCPSCAISGVYNTRKRGWVRFDLLPNATDGGRAVGCILNAASAFFREKYDRSEAAGNAVIAVARAVKAKGVQILDEGLCAGCDSQGLVDACRRCDNAIY